MEDKDLLTLLIAFVLGYFAHQMMRNMCEGKLVEAAIGDDCASDANCNTNPGDDNYCDKGCSRCGGTCRPVDHYIKRFGASVASGFEKGWDTVIYNPANSAMHWVDRAEGLE